MEYIACIVTPILLVAIIFSFVFRKSSAMYWISLVALYFQALIMIFKFRFIFDTVTSFNPDPFLTPNNLGLKLAAAFAVLPFGIPVLLAYFTAAITSNAAMGIGSFIFYSIIQVMLQGIASGQNIFNEKLKQGIKFALPIFSLLLSVVQVVGEDQLTILNMRPSDLLFILSVCCCQIILGVGIIILLSLAFTNNKKKKR
jgi:uncharacterized membrane protein YjfL (UPF0719 family)